MFEGEEHSVNPERLKFDQQFNSHPESANSESKLPYPFHQHNDKNEDSNDTSKSSISLEFQKGKSTQLFKKSGVAALKTVVSTVNANIEVSSILHSNPSFCHNFRLDCSGSKVGHVSHTVHDRASTPSDEPLFLCKVKVIQCGDIDRALHGASAVFNDEDSRPKFERAMKPLRRSIFELKEKIKKKRDILRRRRNRNIIRKEKLQRLEDLLIKITEEELFNRQ